MTITTDFTGTENYAERMAGLEAIHDWWFGAGSFAAAATLGQVRVNLNTILVGTTILNRETFATWLSKVNTLNEPTDYAAALTFGESQSGALWQCTLPSSLRAATDGTGEATIGGTIARINDNSGNALHLTQASTSLRPIRGRRPKTGRRNLLTVSEGTITAYPSRSNVTDAAVPIPGFANGVQFGDNSVVRYAYLNSASVAGVQNTVSVYVVMDDGLPPVVGGSAGSGDFSLVINSVVVAGAATIEHISGTTYRVSATSVPAGVGGVGIVKYATQTTRGFRMSGLQLELGAEVTAYQKASSAYDITEAGVESVSYAAFDLVDDALATGGIAGGLTGQAFVAGDGGVYVSDLSIPAAGSLVIGGTAHAWTGALPGCLRAVTADTGRVVLALVREGAFSEAEIAAMEQFCRAQGAKGLLVPTGPELIVNGTFAADLSGWAKINPETVLTHVSGAIRVQGATGVYGRAYQAIPTIIGEWYRLTLAASPGPGSAGIFYLGQSAGGLGIGIFYAVAGGAIFRATTGTTYLTLYSSGVAGDFWTEYDNISVRRLLPREEL